MGIADYISRLLASFDFITGAGHLARMPALMWAIWGIVIGASLAFWLEAPIYGLRHRRWLFMTAPFLLMAVVSIVVSQSLPASPALVTPAAPPAPPPPQPNFSGSWDTGRWGTMYLSQSNDQVNGTYTYAGGAIQGNVSMGANQTQILRFHWTNRDSGAKGAGFFILAPDAQSFKGEWTNTDNTDASGSDWSGQRTGSPPPPPSFSGVWDTNWGEMRLAQGLDRVNGTYQYAGGLIEGKADGNTLRFKWTNRVTGESGSGKLHRAPDGKSFTGQWNTENSPDALGESWTGSLREAPSR